MEHITGKIKIPFELGTELAEETGLHIGDGSMNYYKNKGFYQLRGHHIDDKKHYQIRVTELYRNLYNLDINLRTMSNDGEYGFQVWSNELVAFKSKILKLPLGKKQFIKIPSIFLEDRSLLTAVVRGIFDTDGSIYLENKNNKLYPRVEIKTTSENLAKQLNKFLLHLGFRNCIYKYSRPERNWNNLYSVIVRGPEMIGKWFGEIKPKNPKHQRKYSIFLKKWACGDSQADAFGRCLASTI